MITRRFLLSSASAFAVLAAGSGLPLPALAADAPFALPAPGTWPWTFTDIAGRSITLTHQPRTFIVANYIANFLGVGGGQSLERVIGLTQDGWDHTRVGEYKVFTQAFPHIREIPSIGGYHDDVLNSERILALRPDVLLIGRSQLAANSERIAAFDRAGITTIVLDYHAMTVANHTKSTLILGRLLGRDAVAAEQCDAYRAALSLVDERLGRIPESEKHRVTYIELGNLGLAHYGNSYNKTILWGAILEHLQADSIAADMRTPYGALDREFVLSRNPETIIMGGSIWENANKTDQMTMGFTVPRSQARARLAAFKSRPLWSSLRAVKSNDLYAVDHGSLRCMMDCHFTVFLAKVLYPQAFADQTPEKDVFDFYRRYLPEIDPAGTYMLSLKEPV